MRAHSGLSLAESPPRTPCTPTARLPCEQSGYLTLTLKKQTQPGTRQGLAFSGPRSCSGYAENQGTTYPRLH